MQRKIHFMACDGPAGGTAGLDAAAREPLDEYISVDDAAELKNKGNELFNAGDDDAALETYGRALRSAHLAPHDRAVLLANRAAVFVRQREWESAALVIDPAYGKALVRRKKACEELGNWAGAARDAKALHAPSAEIAALEHKAKVKAEKDTAEAMESLKGLGNSFLSNFGLSLDSFQMDKDPESGSYSVKMKQ
jgi:tetratricopeptide (TPR) repeat protein